MTPRCLWRVEDYSEHVPLSVKRRVIYACQHGKNYKKTPTTDDLVCTATHFVHHTGDEFSVEVSNSVPGGPLCTDFSDFEDLY